MLRYKPVIAAMRSHKHRHHPLRRIMYMHMHVWLKKENQSLQDYLCIQNSLDTISKVLLVDNDLYGGKTDARGD